MLLIYLALFLNTQHLVNEILINLIFIKLIIIDFVNNHVENICIKYIYCSQTKELKTNL